MSLPRLVQIDLRVNKLEPMVCSDLTNHFDISSIEDHEQISDLITTIKPDVICFEYDYPDSQTLKVLEEIKFEFPSIPILMLTEQHNEQLAIWALRARVWDYLIKPLKVADMLHSIRALADLRLTKLDNRISRSIIKHQQTIAEASAQSYNSGVKNFTHGVIEYIDNNYSKKISISVLAEQCKLSQDQLSRVFKREKGITVRDYLILYRLDKARELLIESCLPVGDIGFSVGFNDHSYFTRIFKRDIGLSPSDYRLRYQNNSSAPLEETVSQQTQNMRVAKSHARSDSALSASGEERNIRQKILR